MSMRSIGLVACVLTAFVLVPAARADPIDIQRNVLLPFGTDVDGCVKTAQGCENNAWVSLRVTAQNGILDVDVCVTSQIFMPLC